MKAVVITFDEKAGLNNDVLAQVIGKAVAPMAKPTCEISVLISNDNREIDIVKNLVHTVLHKTNPIQYGINRKVVKSAVVYISTLVKDELESLNMIQLAITLSKLYREDEKARLAIHMILEHKESLRTVGVKLHHLNHPKVLELLQDIVNFYKDV